MSRPYFTIQLYQIIARWFISLLLAFVFNKFFYKHFDVKRFEVGIQNNLRTKPVCIACICVCLLLCWQWKSYISGIGTKAFINWLFTSMAWSKMRRKRSEILNYIHMITTQLEFEEFCESQNTNIWWARLADQQVTMPQIYWDYRVTNMLGCYMHSRYMNLDPDAFTASTLLSPFLSLVFSNFYSIFVQSTI